MSDSSHSDSNGSISNINRNENINDERLNNETENFISKTLTVCNKYRNNTNTEINKLKKVNEELSAFLSVNNQDMSKVIQAYKDEMIKSESNDISEVIDFNAVQLPSPPKENS